jgi:hypothetical protein
MKRTALITLILGTALAIAPAAGAVVMSDGSGGGATAVTSVVTDGWMSSVKSAVPSTQAVNPATQALLLRSEGLATHYGVNPASQAVILRSTGLADSYGSGGTTFRPDILGGDGGASTQAPAATSGNSIPWNAAIGGAALIGAMLLALGFAVANRRRHLLSF